VPRYVPPASISPKSAASPASVSLSYHGKTLESATDWADAVRTALVKESKGYPDRLAGYLTSTRAMAELASTYSLRLASFFYQELVHAAATLGRKNAEYTQQLKILDIPEEPLPDYLHYVTCTKELISIEEAIVEEKRNCIQSRILVLNKILLSGEARLRSIQYLMEKLTPFLYLPDGYPSQCNRDRRSSVSNPKIIRGAVEYISAFFPANSMSQRSTKLSVGDLQSRATTLSSDTSSLSSAPLRHQPTRHGLRRSDLTTRPPGLHRVVPLNQPASFGGGGGCSRSSGPTGFNNPPQWTAGGSGGGVSYADSLPRPPSPNIPSPPPLTIPSSSPLPEPTYLDGYPIPVDIPPSPDPTHLEAYPTSPSNDTSTLIDTFITNPFTLSGTFSFSLTLTPNQSTNVTLNPTKLAEAETDTDEDPYAYPFMGGDPDGALRLGFHSGDDGRTDYQLGLTDTPDSDSEDQDNYSADDSDPLRYSDYQLGLTDIPDHVSSDSDGRSTREADHGDRPEFPRSPSPEPQYGYDYNPDPDSSDSDSEDQDNYSADDSDPLRYSDYQLGLTDIPDHISTESEEHNSGSPPVSPRSPPDSPRSPSPEPQSAHGYDWG
jgi:hypothetical protein